MHVTEFDYLKWPSIVDVQLVLNHLTNGISGPSSSYCILIECYNVNVNSITSYFSMLIHAIWNLLKKIEGMQVFHTFCISTGKRGMMTSTFISRFSDKKFFLSMRKVLNKKPLFIFMAILLNGTDWAITNQIVSFQLSLLWGIK